MTGTPIIAPSTDVKMKKKKSNENSNREIKSALRKSEVISILWARSRQ